MNANDLREVIDAVIQFGLRKNNSLGIAVEICDALCKVNGVVLHQVIDFNNDPLVTDCKDLVPFIFSGRKIQFTESAKYVSNIFSAGDVAWIHSVRDAGECGWQVTFRKENECVTSSAYFYRNELFGKEAQFKVID